MPTTSARRSPRNKTRPSTSTSARGGGTSRFKLNPAFAAAHANTATTDGVARGGSIASKSIDYALKTARQTGKLHLIDSGLSSPLPDTFFDLRSDLTIDLSMSNDNERSLMSECYGEENLSSVDLSDNNGITELDDRITRYELVRTLRVRRCSLTVIPAALYSLEHLTTLDLSGNSIAHPLPLGELPQTLMELDVSQNAIPSLGDGGEEGVLPNLQKLDVSHNKLTSILDNEPASWCPKLQSLKFSNNSIATFLPQSILDGMPNLTTIEGHNNDISNCPNLSQMTSLTVVDLCDNQLREVPCVHANLTRLALANNKLQSICGLYPQLSTPLPVSNLVELRLNGNQISSLDVTIVQHWVKMGLLDLRNNNLTDLPFILGYLPALNKLPLDGNALRTIRPALLCDVQNLKKSLRKKGLGPGTVDYLPNEWKDTTSSAPSASLVKSVSCSEEVMSSQQGTFTLNLSSKGHETLPRHICSELTSNTLEMEDVVYTYGSRVRTLNLQNNKLTTLEDDIATTLPNISSMDFSKNRLQHLPSSMGDLPLATLILENNRLSSEALHASPLCVLSTKSKLSQSLQHLNISNNHLAWIPAQLFRLPTLSTLVLSHNRITTISSSNQSNHDSNQGWKPGLPALRTLDLSSNQISNLGHLPQIIAGCQPKLKTLLLQNNNLMSIPPELGILHECCEMQTINLKGNPQKALRISILNRSCDFILSYLRDRMDETVLQHALELKETYASSLTSASASNNGSGGIENENTTAAVQQRNRPTPRTAQESKSTQQKNRNTSIKPDTNDEPSSTHHPGFQAPQVAQAIAATATATPLISELRDAMEDLTRQLNKTNVSNAKKYALKKQYAMTNAKLLKEQRRLKAEAGC
eukprot:CAMPEP_0194365552 /NCGR_PEP_ID=MMETSP0174-20130528/13616_1 /TAXON_ID=216777 /ORGANISM="Proboscia alata, Strain PI-D3" /LENGTH=870 /DNA_ID=CAMNT_0039140315 /DNA_START=112 /DNA_END=2724 /DNA_ORIENTATION=+